MFAIIVERSTHHATALTGRDRCPHAHHRAATGAGGTPEALRRFTRSIIPIESRDDPLVGIRQIGGEMHTQYRLS